MKIEISDMFIAHDWCGWNQHYGRFTHIPSCDTLICKPWMNQKQWNDKQLEWFKKYPGLSVYECPGDYFADNNNLMGTTEEIVRRLEEKNSEKSP